MSEQGGGEFFLGFIIGALAGAAAALLLAPTSGPELRHNIELKGAELKDQAQKLAGEARAQVDQLADEARHQADYVQEQGRIVLADRVRKAQEAVQAAQVKLEHAGDAA